MRALYPYNAGAFGLFALESENINSWDDIAGKTIFNGPPRGAALVNARQAIVLASGKSTIGIGAWQTSRLDSCKIASSKALQFVPEKIKNSVAASDAFFPFPDGIEELAETGVKAIIQPGGSINDNKIIAAANKASITMIFTETRHFKH